MRSHLFHDLITTIFDRRLVLGGVKDDRPIEELCRELLSSRGEVSSNRIGTAILENYQALKPEERITFFSFLAHQLDLDVSQVEDCIKAYRDDPSARTLGQFIQAAEPPRQELLRRLNHVPGATGLLVAMRNDLLGLLKTEPDLARADLDFVHLFSSWFNRGFLVLRQISWETPAHILEKIIAYEAVHAINDWDDLRRRLQPVDRRCFAFFHPSMPDEPLVFVEVALTQGIPGSIKSVLLEGRDPLPADKADTAVFYSISTCQDGLRGISFGNSLIKQVVSELSIALPHLKTFVTLSPVPGFNRWLQDQGLDTDEFGFPERDDELKSWVSQYLTTAKRGDGLPKDPVARFHLGNGAILHDVHAGADLSSNGLSRSSGVMVNYLYDLKKVEKNHEEFAKNGTVSATRQVQSLARENPLPSPVRSDA